MKHRIKLDFVASGDIETALGQAAGHLADACRHVANGVDLSGATDTITVSPLPDDAPVSKRDFGIPPHKGDPEQNADPQPDQVEEAK